MRTLFLTCVLCLVACGLSIAEPERVALKSEGEKSRLLKAMTEAKTIDLTVIQDPEVQKAFKAVFDALNLKAKS